MHGEEPEQPGGGGAEGAVGPGEDSPDVARFVVQPEHAEGAYDYGAAGFDFTDLGIEAQAEVVEDWFVGTPAKAMNPDRRNHTGNPMDAQSPYYPYITDNVRVGRF